MPVNISDVPEDLVQLEKGLRTLEEFSRKSPDLLESIREALEQYKRGEINSTDLCGVINPYTEAYCDAIEGHTDMTCASLSIDKEEAGQRLIDEWNKSGRVFTPKSPMEHDLWNAFHECKNREGYRFIVMYGRGSWKGGHPIEAIPQDIDIIGVISSIHNDSDQRLMVLLDTEKTFQEQWPYVPGFIFQPGQLMSSPVIPDDLDNYDLQDDLSDDYIEGVVVGRGDAPELGNSG